MDDGSPIGLLLLFIACIVLSFYFSATEMAFTSVNRIRMRGYAEDGNRRAQRVLAILDDYDRMLTTLLIGNNIVNIGAATIATLIFTQLWGPGAIAMATLVTTVVLFMLGETLPKSFAKACNEQYAMGAAASLQFVMKLFRPLSFVFTKITAVLSKPFRRNGPAPTVTEDELRDIIDDAVEDGALNEETGVLVQSAIKYTDATVRDILTPWKQVKKLRLSTPHEEILEILKNSRHSRLPVTDADGNVVGLLRVRKYLKATLRQKGTPSLTNLMEPVHSISVTMPVDDLLPMMSSHKTHFTLVRDEWDNVLGVVTMEDILERLVGDIWDEDDLEGGAADAG